VCPLNRGERSTPMVFGLSTSEEIFVPFDTILECDGQTVRQTDRQTEGHLCYSNTSACIACCDTALVKIHLSYTKRLRRSDPLTSSSVTWNHEYAPELGAAFSAPPTRQLSKDSCCSQYIPGDEILIWTMNKYFSLKVRTMIQRKTRVAPCNWCFGEFRIQIHSVPMTSYLRQRGQNAFSHHIRILW